MALLKKGGKKEKKAPKTSAKQAPARTARPRAAIAPPDIYTLMLGLAALFFLVSTIVLGLNYYWYQSASPAVIPLNWIR